jgi:hypothetical protein
MTLNNGVILIAAMITCGWIWGSLGVMQRNYALQKELDDKKRELIVSQLALDNAKLEQRYYKTFEYQELAVRERLGLGTAGERALILPPNSEEAKTSDSGLQTNTVKAVQQSNFEQWMNFLFGGNLKKSQNSDK